MLSYDKQTDERTSGPSEKNLPACFFEEFYFFFVIKYTNNC